MRRRLATGPVASEMALIWPEPPWASAGQGRVLHVVGCVTDEVFSFLGPAAFAIARSGATQTIVMIDDQRFSRHAVRLRDAAEVVLAPKVRNPIRQWQAVRQACQQQVAGGTLGAVHLHGLMPCVSCLPMINALADGVAIYFSPHASRILKALPGSAALLRWLVRPMRRRSAGAAIVNMPGESRVFDRWLPTELVESPVDDVFFSIGRHEAPHPSVVTGGRNQSARSAKLFEQFAVLLSGEDLGIRFNWIGSVSASTRARLNAAKVEVFDVETDLECAEHLSRGWVYVAPGATRGFPLFLVEAMAAGLACVTRDCPQHREVIHHGATGYLCETDREMIEHIALLIDRPALRDRIGRAARASARDRFERSRFDTKLLSAYAQ